MDTLLTTVYEGFLEKESFPFNIYLFFEKIDDVACGAHFDMRSDDMIIFKIYSKNVYDSNDDNDPITLYTKTYIVKEKELTEKKLDKERMKKYTKELFDEVPNLRLSTTGTLEVKEEADVIDQVNELFIGMMNVKYSVDKCHKCENKTTTKTPCCKAHLCYRCWFDKVECPTCERDISYV